MTIGSIAAYFFFQLFIPILFTASIASFAWGAGLFLLAGGYDEELADHGKTVMLYGLIVLALTFILHILLSLARG